MANKDIVVQGAREHNLKNIDVRIPKNKLTVLTGLSGSGKSSLAFDTIFAEGQRRYMESFSVFARQFMGQIQRPDVDKISGLSPVISIEQKTIGRNPRSTVGTITEVYDLMRLLYARVADAYSYNTGKRMVQYSPSQIAKLIQKDYLDRKVILLASQVRGRKGHYRELFENLRKHGFLRVRIDGEIQELKPKMQVDRFATHDIEVVVDRFTIAKDKKARTQQSVERALELGDGLMAVLDMESEETVWYSKKLMCADTGISYEEPSPNTFSFNSPYGYCPSCKGIGERYEVDEEAIIPDYNLSLKKGAIAPIAHNPDSITNQRLFEIAKKYKIPITKPVKELSREQIEIILYGDGKKLKVNTKNSYRGTREDEVKNEGIANSLRRYFEESSSDYVRDWARNYMKLMPCETCQGQRLKKEALWFRVADKNIAEINKLDILEVQEWFANLLEKLNNRQKKIATEVLKEINDRMRFLMDIGLHYLTLDRAAGTLSGGESQRIRLATQMGSRLSGITYILDEPSIGLHQEDNHKLIAALQNLRDIGNTVLVVEHDKDIMLSSDHIIDIGPYAGERGGEIVFTGSPQKLLKNKKKTSTLEYLTEQREIAIPLERRPGRKSEIYLQGASGNNLKKVNVRFPLGKLILVTGISGSGKSTLVDQTLYPLLMQHCYGSARVAQAYKKVSGLDQIDKCVEIDQAPIGRTPRSNPATYTGVFTLIRSLFAQLPDSKIRGYKPGRFSFNVKGGRCEHCKGDGLRKVEMNFLPDVYVECDYCHGRRYNKETLEVRYKGHSISDVLQLSIRDAVSFFEHIPSIYRKLKTLEVVGLGYIRLGQSSTTLSGGEAQRVKLATELSKKDTGNTFYILDEPSTGLHFDDIKMLIDVLQKLVDKGNTVLIVEHNMDIIKVADHIIDLGPGGGKLGGEVVAEGTPEEVSKNSQSLTAKYLKQELKSK